MNKASRSVCFLAVAGGLVVLAVTSGVFSRLQDEADDVAGLAVRSSGATAPVDFSGKRITIIVPNREGGALDTYARVIGPALVAELPGSPSLVIRNIPGSGNMAGANHFQARSAPDGLTLLSVSSAAYLNYAMGHKAAKYELANYIPVLISPQGVVVYVRPELAGDGDDPIQGVRDYGQMIFGGHSPTSSELRHLLAFHLLDIDVRGVWGLASGPRRLAFMRGEVHVSLDSASTYLKAVKPMIDAGEAVPLFSYGIRQDGKFVRDPIAPELRTFWEAHEEWRGRPLEGIERKAFDSLYATVLANKGLVLPEGTPDAIVEVYREAMERVIANPEVATRIQFDVGPYPMYIREEAETAHAQAAAMDEDVRTWLKDFLAEHHPVNF
jgi:tripartite-type tricarboxylate transporter receptor subunit TctC